MTLKFKGSFSMTTFLSSPKHLPPFFSFFLLKQPRKWPMPTNQWPGVVAPAMAWWWQPENGGARPWCGGCAARRLRRQCSAWRRRAVLWRCAREVSGDYSSAKIIWESHLPNLEDGGGVFMGSRLFILSLRGCWMLFFVPTFLNDSFFRITRAIEVALSKLKTL